MEKNIFKYNLTYYYQSTLIYFTAFLVYVVIRGEFIEGSFKIITKDPIIHFFGLIVFTSIISLIYNIFKNRHLEIQEDRILFVDRFRTKEFLIENIVNIKITKPKQKGDSIRIIFIRLKNRKRPLILRQRNYQNSQKMFIVFEEIKRRIEKNNV